MRMQDSFEDRSAPDPNPVLARLDHIQALTDELVKARGDIARQQQLTERIQREISAAKIAMSPFIIQNLT